MEYIRGLQLQLVETRDQLTDQVMEHEEQDMADVAVYGIEADVNIANDILVVDGDEIVQSEEENFSELGETATVNDIPALYDDVVGREANKDEIANGNSEVLKEDVTEPDKYERHVNVVENSDKAATLAKFDKDHIEADVEPIKSKVGVIEKGVGDVDVSHLLHEIHSVKKRIGVPENALEINFEDNFVVHDDRSEDDDGLNKLETVDAHTPVDTVDGHPPVKTNAVDDDKQKLYYTDPKAFTGPMT